MKLIKKSVITYSTVTLDRADTLMNRTLAKLMPGAERSEPPQYVGRSTFGPCHVQYDYALPGGDFPVGDQRKDVVFGNELYQGLRPVRHLGVNVYECVVDCICAVEIGTIYQG